MPRGHCIDYWHKWKKEGNFCGLRKQDADMNDTYLSIVEKISGNGAGLDSDFVFDHFTAGAARPLIRCKDPEASTKAMNYVIACLKRGEDVTGGDLQATIEGFIGKKPKSTQMRTPEPVKEPDRIVDANKPILSLAAQQAEKEQHVHPGAICTVNPVVINDTLRESPAIITDTTGKVSLERDNPCGENCPDCPDQCKAITCNELRKMASPFRTAAQLKAHNEDPLEVGKMFQQASVKDLLTVQPKTEKELFQDACQSVYKHGKPDFKLAIDELMRYHPSWKDIGTVIYFCVTDPKEAIVKKK